jgi:hypothetical protein
MSFKFAVTMPDGSVYNVGKLLAKGSQNAKTAKSDKKSLDFVTYSLPMAPASSSGFNLCTSASEDCIISCLFTSGYAAVNPRKVQPARIAKSRMLRLHKDVFIDRLITELLSAQRVAARKNRRLASRLNVFSDVFWEREHPVIFKKFPEVQFYDYSKHYQRMLRFLDGSQFPKNYHLTFSWSGKNADQCKDILSRGGNVAVPFHVKYFRDKLNPLPPTFLGRPVIDGDLTDLRFLDETSERGMIVGLRAKGRGKKDESGFVVKV